MSQVDREEGGGERGRYPWTKMKWDRDDKAGGGKLKKEEVGR